MALFGRHCIPLNPLNPLPESQDSYQPWEDEMRKFVLGVSPASLLVLVHLAAVFGCFSTRRRQCASANPLQETPRVIPAYIYACFQRENRTEYDCCVII